MDGYSWAVIMRMVIFYWILIKVLRFVFTFAMVTTAKFLDILFYLIIIIIIFIIIIITIFFFGGEGYIGFTPSVRPSVRPSRISRPLCSAYSSSWIHFIFIHLIKQLQSEGVSRVTFLAKFQNVNFWQFCTFDFDFFWLGIGCESLVWVIMGRWGIWEHRPSGCSSLNLHFVERQTYCSFHNRLILYLMYMK